MTDQDIAGLVERLKSTAEAWRRKRVDITLGNRFVLINICEQAAAALTALQQEREQIEARVWEEAAKVAYAKLIEKYRGFPLDEFEQGHNSACRNIVQVLRSRASAARNEGGEG